MDGVERVEQLDDKTLRWTASVSGVSRTWIAEIVDQTPGTRIAWKSVDGAENAGAVLFEAAGPGQTTVTLRIDTEPDGVVETIGDTLGFLQRRVKGDLERYKESVERDGAGVDGWRGEIHGEEVRPDPADVRATRPRRPRPVSRGGGDGCTCACWLRRSPAWPYVRARSPASVMWPAWSAPSRCTSHRRAWRWESTLGRRPNLASATRSAAPWTEAPLRAVSGLDGTFARRAS